MEGVSTETRIEMTERDVAVKEPAQADLGANSAPSEPEAGVSDAESMRVALDAAVEAIRPAIQMDGGDMIVHDLRADEGVVDIELTGACVGCPMSTVTLKQGVERILTDRVPGLKQVRAKGIDYDIVDDAW